MPDKIKPAYPDAPNGWPDRDGSPYVGSDGNQGGRMPPNPRSGEQVMPEIDGDNPAD
jgi:hypothetical protein